MCIQKPPWNNIAFTGWTHTAGTYGAQRASKNTHLRKCVRVVEGGQQVQLQHLRDLSLGVTEDLGPLRLQERREFSVLQEL